MRATVVLLCVLSLVSLVLVSGCGGLGPDLNVPDRAPEPKWPRTIDYDPPSNPYNPGNLMPVPRFSLSSSSAFAAD